MMLTEDGNVYTWGRDDDSQLGRGQGLSLDSYAIDYTPLPIELPEGEKVKKMEVLQSFVSQGTYIGGA